MFLEMYVCCIRNLSSSIFQYFLLYYAHHCTPFFCMFGKNKTKNTLSQYVDPVGGFSNRDLRLGTWYVQHKDRLRAFFVLCFMLFDIALLGYGCWGWVEYAVVGYGQDQRMFAGQIAEFEDYSLQQRRYMARPLQFSAPTVFQSGEGVYDFVIDVENTNDRWLARVRYQFSYGGGVTTEQELVVMPGVRQPLAVLGVSLGVRPSAVRFHVVSVSWSRIDPHLVFDVPAYLTERHIFSVSSTTFSYAAEQGTAGNGVMFMVTNDSVFSYWSPQFLVEFRDGEKREGVMLVTLGEFLAGQTQQIQLQSFMDNIFVSSVMVYPLVHFFDAGEYIN